MSRSFLYTICAILMVAAWGCSKDEPKTNPTDNNSLSLSISSLNVNAKASKSTFNITATGSWSISCATTWCTCTPASGSGNSAVELEISENTSQHDRTGKITVTCGSLQREITVSQSMKNTILLNTSSVNVPFMGGIVSAEVQSNVEFDVVVPAEVTWVKYLSTKALQTRKVELEVDVNNVYAPRSAKVVLKEKGGAIADTLIINQEDYYFLNSVFGKVTLQKKSFTLNAKVQSSAETEYAITKGSEWVKFIGYDAAKTTYVFEVQANSGDDDRYGTIVFSRKGGGSLKDSIELRQSGFDGYFLIIPQNKRLEEVMSKGLMAETEQLKLEGELNAEDFSTIRQYMRHLRVIDLSLCTLPENKVPEVAFTGDENIYMQLNKVVLPSNVQSIEYAAFSGCKYLYDINLPESIKNIGRAAFNGCVSMIGHLTLPANLEKVEDFAFNGCMGLDGLTLPKTLKSIGISAFKQTIFESVLALMETPFPLANSFPTTGRTTLIVPKGKKEIYSNTTGWNNPQVFKKVVELGDSFNDYVKPSHKSLVFYGSYVSEIVAIDATSSWKVDSKPSWLTLSKSSGGKGESMVISADPLGGVDFRDGKISISLSNGLASAEIVVTQHSLSYNDGSYVKLQSATRGLGVDVVFVGDGFTIQEVRDGKYIAKLTEAVEHYFDIEPFRSYREYFNVYVVYAFSQESGISNLDKKVNTRFNTKYLEEQGTNMSTDYNLCQSYAEKVPLVNKDVKKVVLVANSTRYAGVCYISTTGCSVAICPTSTENYPYDFRGIVQHEACGHGFSILADEYVNSSGTVPVKDINFAKNFQSYGCYLNIDFTDNRSEVVWRHFFQDPLYTYVGTHEGAYYYTQGAWRPEAGSVMINNIRYMNAPSRELVVKNIKKLAGEQYTFAEFRAKDCNELTPQTKAAIFTKTDPSKYLAPPVLIPRIN